MVGLNCITSIEEFGQMDQYYNIDFKQILKMSDQEFEEMMFVYYGLTAYTSISKALYYQSNKLFNKLTPKCMETEI